MPEHPWHLFGRCAWYWAVLMVGVMLLSACAFRYDKATGGYTGAVACVDITGPGFSWKCTEQSKVPTLPDSQVPK